MDTIIRIVMLILSLIVFIYFTYLVILTQNAIKRNRKNATVKNAKTQLINHKCMITICYAVWMLLLGILYVAGMNLDVLTYTLVITSLVLQLLNKERFISRADIKQLRNCKDS
jgi:hypothetical protein